MKDKNNIPACRNKATRLEPNELYLITGSSKKHNSDVTEIEIKSVSDYMANRRVKFVYYFEGSEIKTIKRLLTLDFKGCDLNDLLDILNK
jgi:hypothetical protein